MITGIIAVVIVISAIVCAINGQWLAFGVGIVLAMLALALGSASRQGDRAFNNFVNYWANRGKDNRSEAAYRRMKKLEESQERWRKEEMVFGMAAREGPLKCGKCGRELTDADIASRQEYDSGARFVSYKCPDCGEWKMVKL